MSNFTIIITTILNFLLIIFNLKSIHNNLLLFKFSLNPSLKLSILSLEITKNPISHENYFRIKFKLENKGEYCINNLKVNFFSEIENSVAPKKTIPLDLLGKNEEIINEVVVYYDRLKLFEKVNKFCFSQDEGVVCSTYSSLYLKCQLFFKDINNKKFIKDYTFILPIELNGRFTDDILQSLKTGSLDFKMNFKLEDVTLKENLCKYS